ncbi:MAG: nucleotidyltransferase family protein [Candidatus Nanopelagicales bacterium]
MTGRTAGVVLAAGAGRRFGGPKAPVVVNGERLVDHAVRTLRDGGCDPIVVVLGAWVGEVATAQVVVNAHWENGMGSLLRHGISALAAHPDVDRVVVSLVDLPGLTGVAVRRLVEDGGDIGACTYHGVRGHPVVFARSHWPGVVTGAAGDKGARDYLRIHAAQVVLVEVGDVADGTDLDFAREGVEVGTDRDLPVGGRRGARGAR